MYFCKVNKKGNLILKPKVPIPCAKSFLSSQQVSAIYFETSFFRKNIVVTQLLCRQDFLCMAKFFPFPPYFSLPFQLISLSNFWIFFYQTSGCSNGGWGPSCGNLCTCNNGGFCDPVHGSCTCPPGCYLNRQIYRFNALVSTVTE